MTHKMLILLSLVWAGAAAAKINPLEKVSIKSARAFTTPIKHSPGHYLVRYEFNVEVDLADKTRMTGDSLEVVIAHKKDEKKPAVGAEKGTVRAVKLHSSDLVKSIVMKGGVKINRQNHSISADRAEILIDKKQCSATGHVKIVQTKQTPKDIPVVLHSDRALLDLASEKLLLVGTEAEPVTTVFELGGVKLGKEKPKA